jgi:ketose-bisphosphate aldolase
MVAHHARARPSAPAHHRAESYVKLVPSLDLIRPARAGGYAIPSFCVWNAETIDMVLRTAETMKAPVLLMAGPLDMAYFGPRDLVAMTRTLGAKYDCSVALHLDHGDSLELVESCVAAGFTSVMLDFSARSLDENIRGVKEAVRLARPRGISVEGEIGMVGKNSDATAEGSEGSALTDPAQAAIFCEQTKVDMVAVSIGNAHGAYLSLPRFDFDRLAELHRRLGIPLVLHGGSGTPEADLKRAISLGIAKINVATEFIEAIKRTYIEAWRTKAWLPTTTAAAMKAGGEVLVKWVKLAGSAGAAR